MRDSTTYHERSTDRGRPSLFDADADDLTDEFWGQRSGWSARETRRQRAGRAVQIRSDEPSSTFRLDDTPASIQAIRDGIAAFRPTRRWRGEVTGPVERTREHGIVRPTSLPPDVDHLPQPAARRARPSVAALPHRDATIAELATGTFEPVTPPDDRADDLESTVMIPVSGDPLTDRLGLSGADPARVRVAVALLALLLAIPLALVLRSTNDREVRTEMPPAVTNAAVDGPLDAAPAEAIVPGAAVVAGDTGTVQAAAAPATAAEAEERTAAAPVAEAPVAATSSADASAPAVVPTTQTAETVVDEPSGPVAITESAPIASSASVGAAADQPATAEAPATRAVPDCSLTYEAAAGDSWYRMADAAGVSPADLLAQNTATIDTVILPGDTICLPPGATVPSPPSTTVAPSTTDAPSTTAAPATTAAPTTTADPIPASSKAEVQALIREIWPDELEDRALEIAFRESRYVATADNGWCCVGVFQLYWTVHRSWLDDYGIHTREQLKDARKNITAAYALYQRSGGWGPWGG